MTQAKSPSPAKKTYQRDFFGKALVELGAEDPSIVVLTADLGDSTRASLFGKDYPNRYLNMGVAEANMMGVAAGLASSGMRPFATSFAIFAIGKAWEQIRQTIAYPKMPVRIVATHAGLTVGEDGASHQILEDISLMRTLPNMSVVVPADAHETYAAIKFLGSKEGDAFSPVYVRLSRAAFPQVYPENVTFVPGKVDVLRQGEDVSLFAIGLMVHQCLDAAEILASTHGIEATVVNVSSIKPTDTEKIVEILSATGAAVTAEEHQVTGGLGSLISEIGSNGCPVVIQRIGVQDIFGQSGSAEALLEHYGLTSETIVKKALEVIKRRDSGQGLTPKMPVPRKVYE